MKPNNKKVLCKEGFAMSVQANSYAYCSPKNDDGPYTSVEVGYPSEIENLIINYAEDSEALTDTVYGYVPVGTVYLVITKHGGMVSGQVPPGVPVYEKHPQYKFYSDTHEDR